MKNTLIRTALLGTIGLGMAGCATNAGNGALIGGATGAGLGALATRGHAGGAIVGGALGAIAGSIIGNDVDRDEAYRARSYQYYRQGYYYAPAPYETRTTYVNPDGSSTTYIQRNYGY